MPVTLFRLVLFDKGFVANDTIRYRITPSKCDHSQFQLTPSQSWKPAQPWSLYILAGSVEMLSAKKGGHNIIRITERI